MIEVKPERCPTCDDTRWERYTKEGHVWVRRCPTCLEARRGYPAGIPQDEMGQTFDDYAVTDDNRDAVEHAKLFVQGVHHGLYIWGPTGTGKTKLACIVAQAVHKIGHFARFVRVPSLAFDLRPTNDEAEDLIQRMTTIPVLILDDVGAGKGGDPGSDYARRTIQSVFDAREDAGLRTIWTSNLDIPSLFRHFGDNRLMSRIDGSALVVPLQGPDYRRGRGKALGRARADAARDKRKGR